jgi:hypothetical protein
MGILSGNPKNEPMHYGEIFAVWSALVTAQSCTAVYQVFQNHTGDKDLRALLEDLIKEIKSNAKDLQDLLKENGLALPPAPPERGTANLENIPPGARLNDPEIAAALSVDNSASMVACSQAMGQSTREDIGMLFKQMHEQKVQAGLKLLRLNKEKGWLIPPPLQVVQSEQA